MTSRQYLDNAVELFNQKRYSSSSEQLELFIASIDSPISKREFKMIDKINTYATYYDWANHLFLKCFYEDVIYYYKDLYKHHPLEELKKRLIISKSRTIRPKSFKGKFGYVNKKGVVVIPPRWNKAEEFYQGIAYVTLNNFVGLINRDGNEIVSPKYDHVWCGEYEGVPKSIFPVQMNGKWGFISSPDKLLVPFIYEEATAFENDLAIVKRNGKYGIVNQNFEEIIPTMYDELLFPSEGFVSVQKDGKYGVVNLNNELVVDFIYDRISRFHEGYASAGNEWKSGFIDTEGNLVIDLKFDYANSFQNGISFVMDGDHGYYINKLNQTIFESIR
jgi:hypothetical protein